MDNERRRHRRTPVDFPVVHRTETVSVLGRAVNACNEGMMVESYMGLETALQGLGLLSEGGRNRIDAELTHRENYRAEAQIKHLDLDFSGNEPCRLVLGSFTSRIEVGSHGGSG